MINPFRVVLGFVSCHSPIRVRVRQGSFLLEFCQEEMARGGEGEREGENVGVWCEGETGGAARGTGVGTGEKTGTRWDCDGISL